ncbi:MAG: hypothetical protein J6I45_07585 [Clostridia bacterium]|nr:hypothetical protein [Clostridia bacterium]
METLLKPKYCRLRLPDGSAELCYRIFAGREDNRHVYSLYVTLEQGSHCESDFIFDITSSREATQCLLDLLSRNTVTPCTLREVLDEIL